MPRLNKSEIAKWKNPAQAPTALLKRLRTLYADRRRWVKGTLRIKGDWAGQSAYHRGNARAAHTNPMAYAFCLAGGIQCVKDGTDREVVRAAKKALKDEILDFSKKGDADRLAAVKETHGDNRIFTFNDHHATTIKDIRTVIDRAIKRAGRA